MLIKYIFISFLLSVWLSAAGWDVTKKIVLAKDQVQTVVVKEEGVVRVLNFRWTLYAGGGLVVHLNYNNAPVQVVLYKEYKKKSYRVALLPKRSVFKRIPYLYIMFNDHEERKAQFELGIDDPEKRAVIEWKESTE